MAAPEKAAGQLVGFGMAANELGIGWVSVWVSVSELQIYDSAILVCDNNLALMCVFMIVVFWMVLACEIRDGPLHTEKARGSFSAHM